MYPDLLNWRYGTSKLSVLRQSSTVTAHCLNGSSSRSEFLIHDSIDVSENPYIKGLSLEPSQLTMRWIVIIKHLFWSKKNFRKMEKRQKYKLCTEWRNSSSHKPLRMIPLQQLPTYNLLHFLLNLTFVIIIVFLLLI